MRLSFAVVAVVVGTFATTTANAQVLKFADCGTLDSYYADLPADINDWTREMLHNHLQSKHRNVVPFTNSDRPGSEDVWGALMDVDASPEPGTISLIYSDVNDVLPLTPFGERTWVRDHLFPVTRGVGVVGPDRTDIHAIRPATPLSNIVAADKYFGECQVLTPNPETCVAPAEGASADSCACERVFTPPAHRKGDIARALLYMDVRYDGLEAFTLDLRLTDCPFQAERDMAYLSQMLTWHMEDPPDAQENIRNFKACSNWQGNRNPFIDFPELASILFPPPSPLPAIGERLIYEKCESIPTLPPTFEPEECDLLPEGDVVPFLLNSGGGGGGGGGGGNGQLSLGLYSFSPLSTGFELFITDNPWNGETFLEQPSNTTTFTDGTIKFTVPPGFTGGNLFGFGLGSGTTQSFESEFETVQGTIDMNKEIGEPLWLYCLSKGSGNPRPLTVLNNGGQLADAFLDTYQDFESALPEGFPEDGIINLEHFDNLLYSGPEDLQNDDLKVAVRDPSNWQGSNTNRFQLSAGGNGGGDSATTTTTTTTSTLMLGLLLSVGAAMMMP